MSPFNNNPTHYQIHLNLDLEKQSFNGNVEITVELPEKVNELKLHIDDLDIQSCQIRQKIKYMESEFDVDQEENKLSIHLPLNREKEIHVKINYKGNFQSDLLGLYKSTYKENGTEKYVLSTQLEEIYARRVFPCNDHPAKKATFSIELEIAKKLKGISNTEIKEVLEVDEQKKLVKFGKTPRMCTYLLYIGVGDFEIRDQERDYHVRLITTPGKTQYGDLALDMAEKSLKFCEDFTSTKYPLNKCDLIAVPDFPFGAMENWGAITFRENMLLVYPDKTSKMGIFNIASVVAHEVSHFWFGNLVSPLDWKYIWLNESFASYFTYSIPNKYKPSWNSWEHYILQYYISSLERDSLNNTFPIEFLTDEEIFITPAKVGIIYNKGATILRMLISYLGKESFQKGIKHFMDLHKFENAETNDYWKALEEATGRKVGKFAKSWILQPGFPYITSKRENNKLILEQNRFTYLEPATDDQWLIPLEMVFFLNNGTEEVRKITFNSSKTEVSIPSNVESYKLNFGQKGFFRIRNDKENLEKLSERIRNKTIPPIDRFGIENDLFAFVKKEDVSLDYYLDFIERSFIKEYDYLPLSSLFAHLIYVFKLKKAYRKRIKKIGLTIIERFFNKYGYESKKKEDLPIGILRNLLLWKGSILGSEEILSFGADKFQSLRKGKRISSDILSSIYKIGISTHTDAIDFLKTLLDNPETPQVEKAYIYQALGCVKEKSQLNQVFEIIINKIPPQSWLYIFRQLGVNMAALDGLWPWFKKNISLFKNQSPFVTARTIAAIVPMGGIPYYDEINSFLLDYITENNFYKDTVEMVLEQLEINRKFSNR